MLLTQSSYGPKWNCNLSNNSWQKDFDSISCEIRKSCVISLLLTFNKKENNYKNSILNWKTKVGDLRLSFRFRIFFFFFALLLLAHWPIGPAGHCISFWPCYYCCFILFGGVFPSGPRCSCTSSPKWRAWIDPRPTLLCSLCSISTRSLRVDSVSFLLSFFLPHMNVKVYTHGSFSSSHYSTLTPFS